MLLMLMLASASVTVTVFVHRDAIGGGGGRVFEGPGWVGGEYAQLRYASCRSTEPSEGQP